MGEEGKKMGRPPREPRWMGGSLAARRRFAGIGLRELGAILEAEGVRAPKSTISSWEAGDGTPPRETMQALARILRCQVEDFFREPEIR
jgi:transcriptional regulator with XRE-family HTH domain